MNKKSIFPQHGAKFKECKSPKKKKKKKKPKKNPKTTQKTKFLGTFHPWDSPVRGVPNSAYGTHGNFLAFLLNNNFWNLLVC